MDDFDSETERAAYFEAGHAVGAWLEDIGVEHISLGTDGNGPSIDVQEPNLTPTGMLRQADDRQVAMSLIRVMLSGPVAQDRYAWGTGGDFASQRDVFRERVVWRAYNLARRLVTGRPILPSLWNQVTRQFDREDTWAAVTALAEALVERGNLKQVEIEAIIQPALLGAAPRR